MPHGIAWPPGCVAFVGGVVAPEASAIVKRVVHWRSLTEWTRLSAEVRLHTPYDLVTYS